MLRNSTMRDKLSSIFDNGLPPIENAHDANKAVSAVMRNVRRSNHTVEEPQELSLPPRYVKPERLKNPFSPRGYSVASIPMEAQDEIQQTLAADTQPTVSSPVQIENLPQQNIFNGSIDLHQNSIVPSVNVTEAAPVILIADTATLKPESSENVQSPLSENVTIADPTARNTISLDWLNQPTPFADDLNVMVEKLRSARQSVIFTLDQHRGRAKEYREKLDEAEYGIEVERENLRQLEDTIAACALVAEQSAGIKKGLLFLNGPRKKPKSHVIRVINDEKIASEIVAADGVVEPLIGTSDAPAITEVEVKKIVPKLGRWSEDPNTLRRQDVLKIIGETPERNWSAAEICAEMPTNKRTRAKDRIHIMLASLVKEGIMDRITTGVYRMKEEKADS